MVRGCSTCSTMPSTVSVANVVAAAPLRPQVSANLLTSLAAPALALVQVLLSGTGLNLQGNNVVTLAIVALVLYYLLRNNGGSGLSGLLGIAQALI